jgi:hypothetical protein
MSVSLSGMVTGYAVLSCRIGDAKDWVANDVLWDGILLQVCGKKCQCFETVVCCVEIIGLNNSLAFLQLLEISINIGGKRETI